MTGRDLWTHQVPSSSTRTLLAQFILDSPWKPRPFPASLRAPAGVDTAPMLLKGHLLQLHPGPTEAKSRRIYLFVGRRGLVEKGKRKKIKIKRKAALLCVCLLPGWGALTRPSLVPPFPGGPREQDTVAQAMGACVPLVISLKRLHRNSFS